MPSYVKNKPEDHRSVPTPEDYPYLRYTKGGKMPYGYQKCKDDPQLIEPIREVLDKLYEAYNYRPAVSWRQIIRWLTSTTGKTLSVEGFRRKYEREQKKIHESENKA